MPTDVPTCYANHTYALKEPYNSGSVLNRRTGTGKIVNQGVRHPSSEPLEEILRFIFLEFLGPAAQPQLVISNVARE